MLPTPTCLISRLHRVLACLISAVYLGDGSVVSWAANVRVWPRLCEKDVVNDILRLIKPAVFVGSSRRGLRTFPGPVRQACSKPNSENTPPVRKL
jgi:hypothetical protein